jgi:hypothetical protein
MQHGLMNHFTKSTGSPLLDPDHFEFNGES